MRVLQLNMHYRGTGADRCARELYEQLPSVGIETAMWVSDRRPGDPLDVQSVRPRWERVLAPLEALPDLTDWRHRGCLRRLRSISPRDFDLVHIHNIHSGTFSIRAVRDLASRLPSVWTLHDEWAPRGGLTYDLTGKISPEQTKQISRGPIRYIPYDRYHDNYKWRRTRRFLARSLPQPSAVICPSRYLAELARASDVFPRSEIIHVPNGTCMPGVPQASMPRTEAKTSFGLLPERPVILLASINLAEAHKGTALGLSAVRGLDPTLGVQVLLVGHGGEAIAKSLTGIPAVSVSAMDDATLARAYRAADVTVIPSLGENFPYVALESLACGTPLVSFNIGGMPEIIGENERGIVCQTLNPADMSKCVGRLLVSPALWQRLSDQGSVWVRETCGMNSYLRSVVRIYDGVLTNRAPMLETVPVT